MFFYKITFQNMYVSFIAPEAVYSYIFSAHL